MTTNKISNLVFATNNKNKLRELNEILGVKFKMLSLNDIGCKEDIPEIKETIEENSLDKALYVYNNYNYNCFADDTGLEIEALNYEPGVYSARYAGDEKDDNANINKVLYKLKNIKNRNARFKTIITLIIHGKELQFEGIVNGIITGKRQGSSGFGYDPIFVPIGYKKSFAEMTADEKNKISHRGIAVNKLVKYLLEF